MNILVPWIKYGLVQPNPVNLWLEKVINASGTISNPRVLAVDSLVEGLKTDGVWPLISEFYLLCGLNNLNGLNAKLKGSGDLSFHNFVSGDYNSVLGLQGNGTTKYIDSNFSPTGVSTNNSHFFMYGKNFGSGLIFGSISGSNGVAAGSYFNARIGGPGLASFSGVSTSGSISATRDSNALSFYQNGILKATNSSLNTGVLPPGDLFLFAGNVANISGSSPQSFSNIQGAIFSAGSALTSGQNLALHNRCQTFLNNL